MQNIKGLKLSEKEQLVENLKNELREKYAHETPLPNLDEAKTPEELKQLKIKYRTMIQWLSLTIDYEKYMLEYMEIMKESSHDFSLFFEDLLYREIF